MPTFYWGDVTGMNAYAVNYGNDVEIIIVNALRKYGIIVVSAAQAITPVRTGALQASITYAVDAAQLTLSIFGTVYYYKFVEYGTKFMSARRMCQTAYEQYEHQILEEIENEIRIAAEAYNTGKAR